MPGLRPRKLGHINRLTADLAASSRFYTEVLGMEVSDYLGDAGIWFHVNSEHHQLALVNMDTARFHHFGFDYYDFGTLRALFDNLAQHGRWLAWGPVRHGIAQNICGYVRITEEPLLVECYADMEQLEPDHEPRQWPDDRFSSNTWGPLPPRSYFRFDEPAIASERESLETLGTPLAPQAGVTTARCLGAGPPPSPRPRPARPALACSCRPARPWVSGSSRYGTPRTRGRRRAFTSVSLRWSCGERCG